MATVYFFKIKTAEKKVQKQQCSLTATKTVKAIASKMLGVSREKLSILKGKNGKPYFAQYPKLHFNVSHSENGIAIAFSSNPIGIDIEKIREINLKTAERFFTKKETDYIYGAPLNSHRRFLEIWTKKEAFIKQKGLTLKDIKLAETNGIYTFEKDGFIISVCSEDKEKPNIIFLSKETLGEMAENS